MRIIILTLLLAFNSGINATQDITANFVAFCYHDVHEKVIGQLYKNSGSLNTKYLINHFQWLKQNNYTVITTQMVKQARNGEIVLPEKSILLSFDDGYKSFYTTIYPLLKQFNYPATYAIVTSWIGNPNEKIMYGAEEKSKSDFMTWEQIKEMSESGLIEIASHTHNSHQGIISNPQDNKQPAMTSRHYHNGKYESDENFQQRVHKDLQKSSDLIYQHTGTRPKTLVWPYGSYSQETWKIAKSLGFETSLTLDDGANNLEKSDHIGRFLIDSNPSLNEFKTFFKQATFTMPQRIVHVDLDYVYDSDIKQQNKNLDELLERIKRKQISTVYLQAFADNDGDGNADALYFPNEHLPVRADLFNRVAWQLRTRSNVKVYAWMPITSFILDDEKQNSLGVLSWQDGNIALSKNNYKRLSVFIPEARKIIFSIYSSLAKFSKFRGILYHDDGLLTDFEDLNPQALDYYKQQGLEFSSIQDLITNKEISYQWAQIKSKALINFTHELSEKIRYYQPTIKTARNIYAQAVIKPISEHWIAQNFHDFVSNYDTTAIMAMPYMEDAQNTENWLINLANIVNQSGLDKSKIVFELQSKNWKTGKKINTQELVKQLWILEQNQIVNYGYYPDDFLSNHPDLELLFPAMSLTSFPYYKR